MSSMKITLMRGLAGTTEDQRATVRSLGLRKIRQSVVREDRPEIRGMVRKVLHLVKVEEV
ncbi:MAG: 50S ribosomal protein L30 [Actinomycetota bacterium]